MVGDSVADDVSEPMQACLRVQLVLAGAGRAIWLCMSRCAVTAQSPLDLTYMSGSMPGSLGACSHAQDTADNAALKVHVLSPPACFCVHDADCVREPGRCLHRAPGPPGHERLAVAAVGG